MNIKQCDDAFESLGWMAGSIAYNGADLNAVGMCWETVDAMNHVYSE